MKKHQYKKIIGGGPNHHHQHQHVLSTLDLTLFVSLGVLILLYSTVLLRTFWSLPPVPTDFFIQRTVFTSDFHRPRDYHDKLAAAAVERTQKQDAIQQLRHVFPVQIGSNADEYETIQHPGVAWTSNFRKKLPLEVPKFWDPAPYGGIREYLGNYGERLMTKEEALSVGSLLPLTTTTTAGEKNSADENAAGQTEDSNNSNNNHPGTAMLETIYVAISSYRDPDCPNTMESLFKWAKHPQRIRVGIVDQIDFSPSSTDKKCAEPRIPCDDNPDQMLCQHAHQIDTFLMDASLAVGPVFARHLGHRMYRGEYFAMQCDAHVRFVQDWDVDLIGQWYSAKNEMAVLTTYLSDIQGHYDEANGKSLTKVRPIMCESNFEGEGKFRHIRHGQQTEGVPGIRGTPMLQPYWAAGFSFSRGHFVVNVPYDQYLPMVFQGEEISLGLRGFTYGYDYYTLERSVCFHIYAIGDNEKKRKQVKTFWENAPRYQGVGRLAMMRLNGIIGLGAPDTKPGDWDHTEEKKYGIGKVRTLQKFFETFGIHPENQTVEPQLCRLVGRPMQSLFVPNLGPDGMGIDYDKIHYKFKDPGPGGGWVDVGVPIV